MHSLFDHDAGPEARNLHTLCIIRQTRFKLATQLQVGS
jgi:hypothetical protein